MTYSNLGIASTGRPGEDFARIQRNWPFGEKKMNNMEDHGHTSEDVKEPELKNKGTCVTKDSTVKAREFLRKRIVITDSKGNKHFGGKVKGRNRKMYRS
jgi:hypothetical protein